MDCGLGGRGVGIRCDEPEAEVGEWEVERRTGNSYQGRGVSILAVVTNQLRACKSFCYAVVRAGRASGFDTHGRVDRRGVMPKSGGEMRRRV